MKPNTLLLHTVTYALILVSIFSFSFSQSMANMFCELLREPSGEFDNFTRMSATDFEYLLDKISPIITKKDTRLREAIPAKVRLAITLRFLATGDSYQSLHFLFKVSNQVISAIVPEVCGAICEVLQDEIKVSK